jgi:hypothetical protein
MWIVHRGRWWSGKREGRTVDGDGNGLAEDVAITALEGRDAAEPVELAVVLAHAVDSRVGVDEIDLEVVGLCNHEIDSGAWVVLASNSQYLHV